MKKNIYLLLSLCFLLQVSKAQNEKTLQKGKIIFQEQINYRTIMNNFFSAPAMISFQSQVMQMYDKAYKQFQLTNYVLAFDTTRAVFQPASDQPKEHQEFDRNFIVVPYDDIREVDLTKKKAKYQVNMLNSPTLIEDSLPKIKWRITSEKREIAGFSCRRANGVLNDSIYVVAFYTPNIPVSAGPETFQGLPGMILGLSLPAAHINWFATSVTADPDFTNNAARFDKKLKPQTNAAFRQKMATLMAGAGSQAEAFKSLEVYYMLY